MFSRFPEGDKSVTILTFEQRKCRVANAAEGNLKAVVFSNENFFNGCPEFEYETLKPPTTYPSFSNTTAQRLTCSDYEFCGLSFNTADGALTVMKGSSEEGVFGFGFYLQNHDGNQVSFYLNNISIIKYIIYYCLIYIKGC